MKENNITGDCIGCQNRKQLRIETNVDHQKDVTYGLCGDCVGI